jgi:type IV secretion system protein VirD4
VITRESVDVYGENLMNKLAKNSNEELIKKLEIKGLKAWKEIKSRLQILTNFLFKFDGPMDVFSRVSVAILTLSILGFITVFVFQKTLGLTQFSVAFLVLIFIFLGFIGFVGFLLSVRFGDGRGTDWYHGTARFARNEEMRELLIPHGKPIPPGSFIVSIINEGVIAIPRQQALQHGIIVGPPGTKKSRGYYLPNCAWGRGSFVCTDPKSELWEHTSGFHKVAKRYAPTDPDASECFNWIPLCTSPRMTQLCATAIMESNKDGNTNIFFTEAEIAYLSALFAHTATLDIPTPLTAYKLFTRQSAADLLDQFRTSKSDIAREQREIFLQTDARIRGGIIPGVFNKLQWLRDPAIQRFTSASFEGPSFGQLRKEAQAIYYCLREQDITRLRPLSSLFFTILLEQLAGEEIRNELSAVPITLLLDEFANIGVIPDFDSTITLARGRGVAIWLGVQALAQLALRYGDAAGRTILSSTSTKIIMHGTDVDTAEYASRMLGSRTVVAQKMSETATSAFQVSTSYSQQEHERPLMTADEIMRIQEDQAIIRVSNRYPMILHKITYKERPLTAQSKKLGEARSVNLEAQQNVIDEEPPPLEL